MPMKITSKEAAQDVVVFQKVLETARGGFTLDNTGLTAADTIPAGSLFGFDEATRKARLVKTATLQASATNTATTYNVLKGHKFAVGDNLAYTKGGKAYAITAIDTTDAAFDVLTVGTTLGVTLSAGDGLFQSSASGPTAAAYIVTPKGLLYETEEVDPSTTVSIVTRGTVYARRAPVVSPELRLLLPQITFSESY